jgi:hypothetical protein
MLHVIQTRYSVYHPFPKFLPKVAGYWKNVDISEEEFEFGPEFVNQKNIDFLYSEDRMAFKFHCFKHLTLPTVQAAMDKVENAEWWIYISPLNIFPEKYLKPLQDLIHEDPRIKLFEFDLVNGKFTNFGQHVESEFKKRNFTARFSTTRLDDDDGIYSDLLLEVETLALAVQDPFIYSSTWGLKCEVLPDGTLREGKLFEHPTQHGAGLVAVDKQVMSLGNHGQITSRFPDLKVVHNRKVRKSFYMSCHPKFTWTRRGFS